MSNDAAALFAAATRAQAAGRTEEAAALQGEALARESTLTLQGFREITTLDDRWDA